MARLARIILSNTPHHITQRGNRRMPTFFEASDYELYIRNLMELSETRNVNVDSFCLMPNHVHLILTPPSREALISVISDLHQRYTRYINYKKKWRGHLWQGRFYSVALSPEHYERCMHYVWSNPNRAGLVSESAEYPWRSHSVNGDQMFTERDFELIRRMTRTGRPRGDNEFMDRVLCETGIEARPKAPGRKPAG
jgi:putative transposase